MTHGRRIEQPDRVMAMLSSPACASLDAEVARVNLRLASQRAQKACTFPWKRADNSSKKGER